MSVFGFSDLAFMGAVGGSAALWTPAQITTTLWLDAADASTITLNGSNVSQWNDKSGNNNHVVQGTTANQPAYTANAIGGKYAVTFDGTNDSLDGSLTETAFSICIVATLAANTALLYYPVGLGGNTGVFAGGTIYNQVAGLHNGSSQLRTNEAVSLNTPYLLTANGDTNGRGVSLNGQPQVTDAMPQSITGVSVGRRPDGNWYMSGPIGEIVIANTVLSVSDRQKLEGYLAHKWGLTANLPAGHPYKTVGPTP